MANFYEGIKVELTMCERGSMYPDSVMLALKQIATLGDLCNWIYHHVAKIKAWPNSDPYVDCNPKVLSDFGLFVIDDIQKDSNSKLQVTGFAGSNIQCKVMRDALCYFTWKRWDYNWNEIVFHCADGIDENTDNFLSSISDVEALRERLSDTVRIEACIIYDSRPYRVAPGCSAKFICMFDHIVIRDIGTGEITAVDLMMKDIAGGAKIIKDIFPEEESPVARGLKAPVIHCNDYYGYYDIVK